MTLLEAIKIPELNIEVTELVEDCFYYEMALLGRISDEQGNRTEKRLKGKYSRSELEKALKTAGQMIDNLDKYGIPCIDMM